MKRDIEQDLLRWKEQEGRLPLLLRGARQTGKSYVVENFGKTHFDNLVTLNFELQPELIRCFDSLDPAHILIALALAIDQKIEPGKTLLFLDEIQDCPNAIRALRYFKEKLPALHVIGAGSLLEFTLNEADFRMPVGRVQFIYLKPLSFKEYLTAFGHHTLREYLEQITLTTSIIEVAHERLLKLLKEYTILGGMPAVLQAHLSHHDMQRNQSTQTTLLHTYRNDFGKYAKQTNHKYLRPVFEKIPGLIAEHFKYSSVDPALQTRDVKNALEMLRYAGLIYPVYSTAATGVPLISLINEKKFKLLFLDVGLVMHTGKLAHKVLLQDDLLLINRGVLAEQFVGQELLAYTSCFEEAEVYFWCREQRSSQAEVDFVTTVDSHIIPIEVKAGATGRLKSLRMFMEEKKSKIGIRISQNKLSLFDNILSVPLYLIGEIPRLVREIV
jgi:uncharacterized protein